MARARKRKNTSFSTQMVKCMFLYGKPNREKAVRLAAMQIAFTNLVNTCIEGLSKETGITEYLVKNDSRSSKICKLKKQLRPEKINTAYCQNAFDMAFVQLSNRLLNIKQDMCAVCPSIFTSSKVLFAMSVDGKTKSEMLSAVTELAEKVKTKKDASFYEACITELSDMEEDVFVFVQHEFQELYRMTSLEYRIPFVKQTNIPLDAMIMKLEKSETMEAPYVISISDMLHVRGERIVVPLNTSKHSLNKIRSHKMAGMVSISMKPNSCLKVDWSYQHAIHQPKTARSVGVDVGISDTLHTSDKKAIGSMKPVIDFYHDEVETSFAALSDMRNKKRHISHYLKRHKNLPENVRRSLIQKMDKLDQMIQRADAPYRKKRHYYEMLDHEIKASVNQYIGSISPDALTVLEKLDIKEFSKSRKSNGMMSTFARGKLQKKLMTELNWRGYDFVEVEPDYTSQTCPVCSCLDKNNRNGKIFKCVCCGYTEDADYVGSLNIKVRPDDKEIQAVCEKYKNQHTEMQKHIKIVYQLRNDKYKAAASETMPKNGNPGSQEAA